MASRSHADAETEAFLGRLALAERRSIGSSLKFCVLAEGLADVYPRFGPTMEWDTAAGDAVLRAAGGTVLDTSGRRCPMERPAWTCATARSWPGATQPRRIAADNVNNPETPAADNDRIRGSLFGGRESAHWAGLGLGEGAQV